MKNEKCSSPQFGERSIFLIFVIFGNSTGAVSQKQAAKIVSLGLQNTAVVGFGDLHAGVHTFEDRGTVCNVIVVEECFISTDKGLVRHNADIVGVENQGITGNT